MVVMMRGGGGAVGFHSCLYLVRVGARKNDCSDFRVRCPAIEVICDGVVGVKVATRIFRNKLEVGVMMS
jgi:hypothetical protein